MTRTLQMQVSADDAWSMLSDAQQRMTREWPSETTRAMCRVIGDLLAQAMCDHAPTEEAECVYVAAGYDRGARFADDGAPSPDDDAYDGRAEERAEEEAADAAAEAWSLTCNDSALGSKVDALFERSLLEAALAVAYWQVGERVQMGEEGSPGHRTGRVMAVQIDPATHHEIVTVRWDEGYHTHVDVDAEGDDLRGAAR